MNRPMIAGLQVSLDGFTQGSDQGGPEWVESWADALATIPDVDAFVQGGNMYPGYAEYWSAIEANPTAIAPFSSRPPTEREVAYARFAAKTPHHVLTRTKERVAWPPTAKVVREVAGLAALKRERGKTIYVVGGGTLVSTLLNHGLLDELRLIVHPLLLGGGQRLFAGLEKPHGLELVSSEPNGKGRLLVTYRVRSATVPSP